MQEFYVLEDQPVLNTKKIIKADTCGSFVQADNLFDAARKQAEAIVERAKQKYISEKERGYQEGKKQASQEATKWMLAHSVKAVEYMDSLESITVELVMESLRKVVGHIDDNELILRCIKQSLQYARGQKKILIKVRSEDEQQVRSRLSELMQDFPGTESLEVMGDPSLGRGDCILQTELGSIDGSVETQLRAIEQAFLQKLARGKAK